MSRRKNKQLKKINNNQLVQNHNNSYGRSIQSLLTGLNHNGNRDYNSTFGYPDEIDFTLCHEMYKRNGIASRVINSFPEDCWRVAPSLIDVSQKDKDVGSEEEIEIQTLANRINLFGKFQSGHILSLIGRYSIAVVQVADGKLATEQLVLNSTDDIERIEVFSEKSIQITKYDNNPTSKRFGLPVEYTINSYDLNGNRGQSFTVNYTRVVHLSPNKLESLVYSEYYLADVFNLLLDLAKVSGSASETYWLNGRGFMIGQIDSNGRLSSEDKQALSEAYEDSLNGNKRYLINNNTVNKYLDMPIPRDTDKIFNILISQIGGTKGYPKRKLIGTENGVLASSQDEASYDAQVDSIKNGFCTEIIKGFLTLLQDAGLYKGIEFGVVWEDTNKEEEKTIAETANIKMNTLAIWKDKGLENIISEEEIKKALNIN